MRASITGSAVVHIVALILLFAVRYSAPLIVPGDVVQVALVDMPQAQPRPEVAPPKPKAPEPEPMPIKPVEDSGVKILPPKPKPKPKAPEPKAEEPPQPAVPYEKVGNAGLSGSVAVDANNFEFTYYLLLVRNRVAQNWTAPSGIVSGGQPVRAVVYFKIARDGNIIGIALETSSGREYFDRSTLRAVTISNPLPPLPEGFKGPDLGVHFGFEFAGP